MRVLVLGGSGMLGNAMLRFFSASNAYDVFGTVRSPRALIDLPQDIRAKVFVGIDVLNFDQLVQVFNSAKPQVLINCVGVVKQLDAAEDPLVALPINALLPHRLARLCDIARTRLIHVSTDCVFAGTRGQYREHDLADAQDLYGRSKYLGEVDYPNAITLRTSIIGHEFATSHGLVEWFLRQTARVRGYRKALFSGLPTVELARVIRDYVLTKPELHGVYHVSAASISKHDLLHLVKKTYARPTEIEPDDSVVIDRSLDSTRFRSATGYKPPSWDTLVQDMHDFR